MSMTLEAPRVDTTSHFATIADDQTVAHTAAALEANGITVLRAASADEARELVLGLIPDGAAVHQGASKTLDDIGVTAEIEGSGHYQAIRPKAWQMDRATQGNEIRQMTSAPEFMLGSVHAVTEGGSLMTASMSGAQLGPYASGAGRVILVVGTHKIVPDLDEGMRRINEHSLPLEDARAQAAYGVHSSVNKVLIVNREMAPGRTTVVLVDEALGF